jgi:hypothetical protein
MNTEAGMPTESKFSIEDIVSYSNIEITNANDNRPPVKSVAVKIAAYCIIAALVAALLFM